MKVACIDIGTNSIRLLMADFDGICFADVHKKLRMTRLGKGVNETRMLDEERISESVEVIVKFSEDAIKFGAALIYLMATSAVRDSINAKVFTDLVYEETGHKIDVLSGKLEAEVGFLGVLLGSSNKKETILVIDIGGGSTELIVGNQNGILFSRSLDIGAVRLTDAHIHHDPVLLKEKSAVVEIATEQIKRLVGEIKSYNIKTIVGIGGTATTYATMQHKISKYSREEVHQKGVTLTQLNTLNEQLEKCSNQDRKRIVGLEEKRADIIYAGGLILQTILENIEADNFYVSDYDNLEGYIAYKWSTK